MYEHLRRVRVGALPAVLMLVVAASATEVWAQARGSGVAVLVVADDEDRASVKRSSAILKRAMDAFGDGLKRAGFRAIDEESVATGMGWRIRDRSSRQEIIRLAQSLQTAGKVQYRAPAVVLVRMFASMQRRTQGRVALSLRMGVDIYDTRVKHFLEKVEVPERVFPAPRNCLEDIDACIAPRAGELAVDVSVVAAMLLSRHLGLSPHGQPPAVRGERPVHGARDPVSSGHGVMTPYAVTLRYFETREALAIVRVMADEFPGYREHEMLRSTARMRQYSYVTTAKAHKLEEWLVILLRDMGFEVDKNVKIVIEGSEIAVEKVALVPDDTGVAKKKRLK